MRDKRRIKLLSFLLGLTSMIGQVLLLRELVAVFYGNETAYAIILASWLFWVALGSLSLSKLTDKIKTPLDLIVGIQCGLALVLPVTIVFVRNIDAIMNIQTGELLGIIPMCVISFLLLAPLALILGGLFTLICHLSTMRGGTASPMADVATIYLWEAVGAVTAGLVFSFILVHLLPAIYITFLIGGINLAAIITLYDSRKPFFKVALILILMVIIAVSSGLVGRLERWTRSRQWKGFDIVALTDSIYGNLALIKVNGDYSLFENGLLSYTTRDELTSEENVHFSMLEHPDPRKILLIGGGMAGNLREIFKYGEVKVDYIELDPTLIELSAAHLPNEFIEPLKDPRVNITYTDGRLFVKRAQGTYDIVIINLPDPQTALINRYYSLEFFEEVDRILNPNGILSLSVSSSANYLNQESRDFLRTIHSTLRAVFPDVKSIPGDTNIFLACKTEEILTLDAQAIIRRLKERNIKTKYVNEYYLPYKLSEDRIFYIEDILKEPGELNTDMHPVAYLYDIVLWSTHFNTVFKDMIERIRWVKLRHLMIVPFLILVIGWPLAKLRKSFPVTLSIVTTGFSEIVFQVIVILAFQTLYGYAYYRIGLIMASFMAGLIFGSLTGRNVISRDEKHILKIYKIAQFGIFLYPLLLPPIFILFRDMASIEKFGGLFAGVFACLPIIAGFIGGLQYPLATQLVDRNRPRVEGSIARSAGFLYAADVFGATVGALITGAILIPLLGIAAIAFLCAALNGTVFLLLLGHRR